MGAGVVDITSSNYDIDIQSLGCQNCEILKTFNTILNFEEVCEISNFLNWKFENSVKATKKRDSVKNMWIRLFLN